MKRTWKQIRQTTIAACILACVAVLLIGIAVVDTMAGDDYQRPNIYK